MNRVRKRAWIMMMFLLGLVGGMCFFLFEYWTKADQWVVFQGSPHVYQSSSLGSAVITDREGKLLLDTTDGRVYASDAFLRQATIHWLGDRQGNIRANAIGAYTSEIAGFDRIDGVYSYADACGEAALTLSARVQTVALRAMAGRKGTVAVYNYKTGEVLCAVSTPTYDPDNVPNIGSDTSGIYEGVYMNRFTQTTYPPGSIFKIVTTAAALDCVEGILDMRFTCDGVQEFGVDRVTCEQAHGTLDLKTALAKSCNCCFAQIAQLIGNEKMTEYVEKFQIMDSVSFDGISTVTGNFDLSDAAPVELAWACIGQYTDMINPCRYMTFMGAIANGGSAAIPHLVEEIRVGREVTYDCETVFSERIMQKELADTLISYMRNNVISTYGANHFPGLTVCAKSGTSELGGGRTPNAMFAGFVADEEYPLAFIVVVENGGYGASACVPILKAVLAECKAVLDES